MFDTFDILVPALLSSPLLSIRTPETTFGSADERCLYVRNDKLGKVLPAHVAFSSIEAWTGAPNRADWTVLLVHEQANLAAQDDVSWRAFLDAVHFVLTIHPKWRVTCESDCEQYPLERMHLTPEGTVALLDSYRKTGPFPISLCCECPA